MPEEKKVKDIMNPIEEYDTVDIGAQLCDVIAILKRNYEKLKAGEITSYHKTIFVTDAAKEIVGKLSMYDLVRGMVPESAKKAEELSVRALTSRAMEVADQGGEFQERFKWLHSSFFDLVKQEAHKTVKEIMSPVAPELKEDDPVNLAIYILFKNDVRQQLVQRDNKIVGVVNLIILLNEFLEVASPECYIQWE